jgi:hypothetical protein
MEGQSEAGLPMSDAVDPRQLIPSERQQRQRTKGRVGPCLSAHCPATCTHNRQAGRQVRLGRQTWRGVPWRRGREGMARDFDGAVWLCGCVAVRTTSEGKRRVRVGVALCLQAKPVDGGWRG